MRLKSVETTPNPNSMKLNLDEQLGSTVTYTLDNKKGCPEFVDRLLEVDGVKSVFVCSDFVTLNRDPRADWRLILEKATAIFVHDARDSTSQVEKEDAQRSAFEKEGQVQVLVQTFRGVPIQVKVVDGEGEARVSLGARFNEAAMFVQDQTGSDFLKERYWAEHGVRYGERAEIASEVAAELSGIYDDDALERVKNQAVGKNPDQSVSQETIFEWLKDSDWHRRLSAVQELSSMEGAVALLSGALSDEHPQVRRLAAAALGTTGSAYAVPPLCYAVVNDPSIGVRRTAGDALSDLGDVGAQRAMCKALSDANKLVRWRAARFLFDVGTEEALPFLEEAGDDPEFEVRLEIEAAKQRIRGGAQGSGPAWKRIVER